MNSARLDGTITNVEVTNVEVAQENPQHPGCRVNSLRNRRDVIVLEDYDTPATKVAD